MATITYLVGDATKPIGDGNKVICHICNDIGAWGAGFVLAVSKRWKKPKEEYRNWYKSKTNFVLGNNQYVKVEDDIVIANMIGQRGIRNPFNGVPPIRYDAVEKCLEKLAIACEKKNATVHMPRIGCGLAGGTWDEIEKIINRTLIAHNVNVFVYDFE